MTNVYKIESIGDFLKIPSDRIHACLNEMANHMSEFKAGLEVLGIEPTGAEIKTFTWEDDGKNDLNITLNCEDGRSTTVKIVRGVPAND
ncbi:hypothetical protein E0H89_03740 [Acinetobacter sp. ANC 3781]|uniref:hypothetical protein n=1 Tax=Acinetobacter sp. ANC 3781 TaxID=2529835 RepID=UPI00103E92C6|nr:hypothetical protein [Acinetobacter sp. ANC 3781]TCB79375.1 hypothetical protein E0H89_03740 [Acinetobacter sp. ANC 3781]